FAPATTGRPPAGSAPAARPPSDSAGGCTAALDAAGDAPGANPAASSAPERAAPGRASPEYADPADSDAAASVGNVARRSGAARSSDFSYRNAGKPAPRPLALDATQSRQGETMTHTSRRPAPPVRRWLAAAAVLALAALTAPLAAGADQPNLPIGTSPAPATASVSPGGQGNACAAGQTAAVDPTASALTDAAQIGAGDCSGGGTAGTSSASTPTGGTGDAGSASGHRTTATAASTSGASTRASVLEAVNASELEITAVRF